jgi:heme exporter protein D
MRNLDFSSWQAVVSTLLGLAVITLIGVGIRLLVMQTVQQRRERENRQINERLRTLIAAYKTLGGSFTGNLAVDPAHLRDLKRGTVNPDVAAADALSAESVSNTVREWSNTDRSRRIRDAVEAALSDIILLGTEEQVKLAATVATELAAGRPAHTAELVVSLRDFIRQVLDLDPVPTGLSIPKQGPTRPSGSGGGGKGERGVREEGKQGGDKGAGAAAGGGMGLGIGFGGRSAEEQESDQHHSG